MKRCYIAKHDGMWLGGYSVIFAETPDEASAILKDLLAENNLSSDSFTIREIKRQGGTLIWDGDY